MCGCFCTAVDFDVLYDRRRWLHHHEQSQEVAVLLPRRQSSAAADADRRHCPIPCWAGSSWCTGKRYFQFCWKSSYPFLWCFLKRKLSKQPQSVNQYLFNETKNRLMLPADTAAACLSSAPLNQFVVSIRRLLTSETSAYTC